MTASAHTRQPPDHPRLRSARSGRGGDGRLSALRPACGRRALCQRILALRSGPAVSGDLGVVGKRRARGIGPRHRPRGDLVRRFFRGRSFLLASVDLATTVANATFFATTSPIWVALGAWLLLSEKIGARTIGGLALCMLGGAALIGQSWGFAPHRLIGDLYGLITAIFFGSYMLDDPLRARHARRRTIGVHLHCDHDRDFIRDRRDARAAAHCRNR